MPIPKTVQTDASGKPMKMDGWFSWRHKTRVEHDAARERYLLHHGPAARRRKAAERSNPAAVSLLREVFAASRETEPTTQPSGEAVPA